VLPSDIHLHPNGQLLYVANRGAANSISVLRITDGAEPVLISETPTYGLWPRDFAVSPDGHVLVIANQHSNELSVVRLDTNGLPEQHLSTAPCDAVSSVMFCEPLHGREQRP
jgi:6-phosphogluconolactonase